MQEQWWSAPWVSKLTLSWTCFMASENTALLSVWFFYVCNRDQDIFRAVPDRCSEDWLVNAARMFWKYRSFFFKVFCGHRLSVNKGSLEHCQLFKYSKPRKAVMRWWMPEEPDVRLVPPERACCKQIHDGFGASKSINRLSNDRLEQQISCVWGSTEPISC